MLGQLVAAALLAGCALAASPSPDPSCSSPSCAKGAGHCPADNPVESFFGSSALKSLRLAWTGAMPWTCVQSIVDFPQGTFVDRVAAAAQAATARGSGGVVFVPAGSYDVEGDIILPSGVVLRGEPTTAAAKDGTNPGKLAPKTVLSFPELAYNGISCSDNATAVLQFRAGNDSSPAARSIAEARARGLSVLSGEAQEAAALWTGQCSSAGVVNIDSDGGFISLAGDGTGAPGSWMLAHGNRVRNVNYQWPEGPTAGQQPNEWPWRFATALGVVKSSSAAVTNNLLAPATLSKRVKVTFAGKGACKEFSGEADFHVDNRYGLHLYGEGGLRVASATIAGNYVWQNGRVGVFFGGADDASAGAGNGVLVQDNHVSVAANSTLLSVDGRVCAGGSDTNENRGYDQTGNGSSVISNTGHINRQRLANGYETVDGEGVLQQPQDGNFAFRNVWRDNDLRGGATGYLAYYGLLEVAQCDITGNHAAAGEAIGVLKPLPGLILRDNKCSGNDPPASNMHCHG